MLETKVAGGVVLNKEGAVLVVNKNHDSWSLPKGHLEDSEDALEAAKREIQEESGVSELEFVKELGSYKRYKIGKHEAEDKSELKEIRVFLFHTDQMSLHPVDPTNPEARWVAREEVVGLLTHKKDKEFWLSIKDKLD